MFFCLMFLCPCEAGTRRCGVVASNVLSSLWISPTHALPPSLSLSLSLSLYIYIYKVLYMRLLHPCGLAAWAYAPYPQIRPKVSAGRESAIPRHQRPSRAI